MKSLKFAKCLISSKRYVSNHNFETNPIIPLFWRGKNDVLDEGHFTIDTTNENLLDGPEKNPILARKMMEQFHKIGLVRLRGNREIGDHLEKMRDWLLLCFPKVAKYEGQIRNFFFQTQFFCKHF